jgi:hypothetical protein
MEQNRFRTTVVAGGAILMVGCAAAALAGSWMFYSAWPGVLGGRYWIVLPFAPLTVAAITVAGINWTRRLHSSTAENLGALLLLELILWGAVGVVVGSPFVQVTFLFWAAFSVAFAPWWLLATWIGRRSRRTEERA